MDENKNNGLGKGLKYLGLAALFGGMMYGIGKLRAKGKIPLTALGLTAIVVAPKGFEVIKSCSADHKEIRKTEIYVGSRKDSIETVLKLQEYEQHKKDTTAVIYKSALESVADANRELSTVYKKVLNEVDGYNKAISNTKVNYEKTVQDMKTEHSALEKKVKELETQKDNVSKVVLPSNDPVSTKDVTPSKTYTKNAEVISYYVIDADKSDRKIKVYGVYSDGECRDLKIYSRASFNAIGGPADGIYRISNKGRRTGNLYPGFLEMADPVGISGAGSDNQYLSEIQTGAYSNKTGIRVPNDIYLKLESLVNSHKTLIRVHD